MKRRIINFVVAISVSILVQPVQAKAKISFVKDLHLMSLIHGFCDLRFNDNRAKRLAATYAEEEGGLDKKEVAKVIVSAEETIKKSIELKQQHNLCIIGKASKNKIPQKWLNWVSEKSNN